MDWHMYLILFIAMILFMGIVLFAQRMKKQPKDPLSVWNPENFSLYFDSNPKAHLPHDHGDLLFDPMFSSLPGNVYHKPFHKD